MIILAPIPSPAAVVEIDYNTNYSILADWNGEAWATRNTDFFVGELVIVELNDNGTASIYDDIITEIFRGK